MNIAIIYHDADYDGKLSNVVCRYHLTNFHPDATIHSYGWDYGRPLPESIVEWSDYDQIYVVDLSIAELMSRSDLRDKIVWIDHHKSAIEKWDCPYDDHGIPRHRFKGYRIDGVAACRLCWQWFLEQSVPGGLLLPYKRDYIDRRVQEPDLIRLAGEYDVWDHRDPDAKALQFGLRSISDDTFYALVHYQFACGPQDQVDNLYLAPVIDAGRKIKAYCDKNNAEYARDCAHTIKWEGLTFCVLNIGQRGNSDLLLGGIKPEHDACFAWRYVNGTALVSLYHIAGHEQHDLSQIAVKYGGGGHRGACGFRLSLMQLQEIFEKGQV